MNWILIQRKRVQLGDQYYEYIKNLSEFYPYLTFKQFVEVQTDGRYVFEKADNGHDTLVDQETGATEYPQDRAEREARKKRAKEYNLAKYGSDEERLCEVIA